MIAYHGTTQLRARRIFEQGFLPKPPSRRVWFAESRGYAMGRAQTQARRARQEPVVLACDLDLDALRHRQEVKRVVYRKGIIAVDGPVPASALLLDVFADMATVPEEVAAWVNGLLGLGRRDSVRPNHPGLARLSRWINARAASEEGRKLRWSELVEKARRWLPEHFAGVDLSIETVRRRRRVGLIDFEVDALSVEPDPREAEALDLLEDPDPSGRVRGLSLLAAIHDPDLFDWCAMFADDESPMVQVAALRIMGRCADGSVEVLEPLAASDDRRVRAAAIAAAARHAGDRSARWIERGLRDPEVCVRVETVPLLETLDPRRHRAIFDLARNDPNPDVAARARKLGRHT